MRIVFMGTPDFCIPTLNIIHKKHDIVGIFCQPDKPNGRGNKVVFCPVKEFAVENNINIFQPTTFKDECCKELLDELCADVIVVAAYGKILPEYVLNASKYGCYNIHGSLLPQYRGASPIQTAILNGDNSTGITIIEMSKEMDAGDIVYKKEIEILKYETAEELFERMSVLGAECIDNVLTMLEESIPLVKEKQNHSEATFCCKISKEDGLLDFKKMISSDIVKLVYGLNSWPSAYFISNGIMYKVHRVLTGRADNKENAGKIIEVSKNGIEVVCADGKSLIITEIQKQGKKKMDARSFSNGQKINIGEFIDNI